MKAKILRRVLSFRFGVICFGQVISLVGVWQDKTALILVLVVFFLNLLISIASEI